jgi:hypothetical protein
VNTPVALNDNNACTTDACDSVLGVTHSAIACNDGNACTTDTCNPAIGCTTKAVVACVSGDGCCAPGCTAFNDADCFANAPGVQQNISIASLTGWSQCYSADYADASTNLTTLLAQCSKPKLLMACGSTGAATYTLLAMAPRPDVLFECGTTTNCTKQSNGVGWYFNNSWSWGFAPGGQPVNRNSCDFNSGGTQTVPGLRLCWHTSGNAMSSGYRCGSNAIFDASLKRAVYQAD